MTLALLSAPDALVVAACVTGILTLVLGVVNARAARANAKSLKPNGGKSLENGGTIADAMIRVETRLDGVDRRLDAGGQRMEHLEHMSRATLDDIATLRASDIDKRAAIARIEDRVGRVETSHERATREEHHA